MLLVREGSVLIATIAVLLLQEQLTQPWQLQTMPTDQLLALQVRALAGVIVFSAQCVQG